MHLFHDWRKDGEPTFTPPAGATVKGVESRLVEKIAFGFTTQAYKCAECPKRKLQDYVGDQRENL